MRRWLSACVASLLWASAAAASPTEGDAQVQVQGREHFKRGVDLFRHEDFRAALIEFNRAYEVAPSYRIQFNIGQTCVELQDYACALRAFEKYLRDGGREVSRDRSKQVEQDLARLRKLVATIEVEVNEADAEIEVDDVRVGTSPLPEPLLVGAGRHKITVRRPPAPEASRVVDVAGGDSAKVAFELVDPPPVAPPPPPRDPGPVSAPSRGPVWVSLAVTGALGASALVTGALTLSAKSDLDASVARFGATSQEIDGAQSKVETLSLTTDVLLAATVVGAGLTTVFFFTTRPSSAGPVRARIGAGVGAVTLAGSF